MTTLPLDILKWKDRGRKRSRTEEQYYSEKNDTMRSSVECGILISLPSTSWSHLPLPTHTIMHDFLMWHCPYHQIAYYYHDVKFKVGNGISPDFDNYLVFINSFLVFPLYVDDWFHHASCFPQVFHTTF